MSKLNEMMANDDQLVKVGELKEELLKEMDELYIEHVMKPLYEEMYKAIRNEYDSISMCNGTYDLNEEDYARIGYFTRGVIVAEGEFGNNMLKWHKAMKDKITEVDRKGGTK